MRHDARIPRQATQRGPVSRMVSGLRRRRVIGDRNMTAPVLTIRLAVGELLDQVHDRRSGPI